MDSQDLSNKQVSDSYKLNESELEDIIDKYNYEDNQANWYISHPDAVDILEAETVSQEHKQDINTSNVFDWNTFKFDLEPYIFIHSKSLNTLRNRTAFCIQSALNERCVHPILSIPTNLPVTASIKVWVVMPYEDTIHVSKIVVPPKTIIDYDAELLLENMIMKDVNKYGIFYNNVSYLPIKRAERICGKKSLDVILLSTYKINGQKCNKCRIAVQVVEDNIQSPIIYSRIITDF